MFQQIDYKATIGFNKRVDIDYLKNRLKEKFKYVKLSNVKEQSLDVLIISNYNSSYSEIKAKNWIKNDISSSTKCDSIEEIYCKNSSVITKMTSLRYKWKKKMMRLNNILSTQYVPLANDPILGNPRFYYQGLFEYELMFFLSEAGTIDEKISVLGKEILLFQSVISERGNEFSVEAWFQIETRKKIIDILKQIKKSPKNGRIEIQKIDEAYEEVKRIHRTFDLYSRLFYISLASFIVYYVGNYFLKR